MGIWVSGVALVSIGADEPLVTGSSTLDSLAGVGLLSASGSSVFYSSTVGAGVPLMCLLSVAGAGASSDY